MLIRKFKMVRKAILIYLTHNIALPMLKIFRRPGSFEFSKEDLQKFERGTLGHDLYLFLKERNLPLLKYYARHDLKHILLGYDTTEEGEACLQSFMFGNGRVSFPVLATMIYSYLLMPEYHKKMKEAYLKGKACTSIHKWSWNELVHKHTDELRKKLFKI